MLGLVVGPLASVGADYALRHYPTRQIACTFNSVSSVSGMSVNETVLYYVKPPPTPRQKVTMEMDPVSTPGFCQGDERFPLLFRRQVFNQPQNGASVGYELVYRGQLLRTVLVQLTPGTVHPAGPTLPAFQRKDYTARTDACDYDSPIVQNWLNGAGLKRRGGESDLDFGKRVFTAMCTTFHYDPAHGSNSLASLVVRDHAGVCGGLSIAFCAAMRASGVPCRVLSLQQVAVGGNVGGSDRGHATNEFFCEGIGWVPCDLTGGCTNFNDLTEGLTYFGQDRGDTLMTFNGSGDFRVDTLKFGSSVPQPSGDCRKGCAAVPPAQAYGSWGLFFTGNGNAQYQNTDSFYARLWTDKAAYEKVSPDGQPTLGAANQPAFSLWRDTSGWHIHSSSDAKAHEFEISVYPEQPIGQGQMFSAGQTEQATTAVGYNSSAAMDTAVPVQAGSCALRFLLTIDHRDMPGFVYIGAKGVHPSRQPFTLAAP
jgi:hypothetical protein